MASVLGLDIIGKTEKGRQQLTLVCIVVFFFVVVVVFCAQTVFSILYGSCEY